MFFISRIGVRNGKAVLVGLAVLTCGHGALADPLWDAARQLEREERWEEAAQAWAAFIAENSPTSVQVQDAALRAGYHLGRVGRYTEAVPLIDLAINIGHARAAERGSKGNIIKKLKREALFGKGRVLESAGDPEAAALAFRAAIDDVAAELAIEVQAEQINQTNAPHLLTNANWSARYLEDRGELDGAMVLYDQMIALGDRRADTAIREIAPALRTHKRDGLVRKAAICQRQGCVDEALAAIQRLQTEFPASHVQETAVIAAQLTGGSVDAAFQRIAREQQACALLEQGAHTGVPDDSLVAAERVLAEFPDTTTFFTALETKARVLEWQGRFDAAEAVYLELLDGLRPIAPQSELFQSARVRLQNMLAESITAKWTGSLAPVSSELCERLRSVCLEVIQQDTRPDEVEWAWIRLFLAYFWDGKFAESLDIASQFLAAQPPDARDAAVIEMHFFAAMACQHLGQHQASYPHLRWLIDSAGSAEQAFVYHAYHRIWCGLKMSGASEGAVQQIVDEFNSRFPNEPEVPASWVVPPKRLSNDPS